MTMAVLSAQTIRKLSLQGSMIDPYVERSVCENSGMSYGLSSCGYDIRIREQFMLEPGDFTLASSIERFRLPTFIKGGLHDKSSLARRGLSVFNTILEPGWEGYLTLELTNHGPLTIPFFSGQPIAQIVFDMLDAPTEQPYPPNGKYQNQPPIPVNSLWERS